jgi:hypothetical protein
MSHGRVRRRSNADKFRAKGCVHALCFLAVFAASVPVGGQETGPGSMPDRAGWPGAGPPAALYGQTPNAAGYEPGFLPPPPGPYLYSRPYEQPRDRAQRYAGPSRYGWGQPWYEQPPAPSYPSYGPRPGDGAYYGSTPTTQQAYGPRGSYGTGAPAAEGSSAYYWGSPGGVPYDSQWGSSQHTWTGRSAGGGYPSGGGSYPPFGVAHPPYPGDAARQAYERGGNRRPDSFYGAPQRERPPPPGQSGSETYWDSWGSGTSARSSTPVYGGSPGIEGRVPPVYPSQPEGREGVLYPGISGYGEPGPFGTQELRDGPPESAPYGTGRTRSIDDSWQTAP